MTIFNVQRAITQKVSKPDLQFSFSASLLMVLHICVKFTSISQKLSFSMFKDPYLIKQLSRLMIPVFYMSSYVALHFCKALRKPKLFVCVEVLRPSQPNGVMSSAVSLPNHTFTGQA